MAISIILFLCYDVVSGLRLNPDDSDMPAPQFDRGYEGFEDTLETESPMGWLLSKPKDDATPVFLQMHIPRTAGSSLSLTLQKDPWLPHGSGLYSDETCLYGLQKMMGEHKNSHIVTIMRDPVGHVYSIFTRTCKTSCHDEHAKDIHKYIDYVHQGGHNIKENGVCYDARNMQTRSFNCRDGAHNGNHEGEVGSVEEAKRNLDNTSFVLIQEHYKESLCVMYAKLNGKLPGLCNCEDPSEWKKQQPRSDPLHDGQNYQSPKDAMAKLTEDDRRKIADFTKADAELYEYALDRFKREVKEVQETHKTKILCK